MSTFHASGTECLFYFCQACQYCLLPLYKRSLALFRTMYSFLSQNKICIEAVTINRIKLCSAYNDKRVCDIYNYLGTLLFFSSVRNLFVVNGEYITACNHDDAVNILRNAGDIVVLTVKHYRAAKPFLQKNGKYTNIYTRAFLHCHSF